LAAIARQYEELNVRCNHETKDKAALSQAKPVKELKMERKKVHKSLT
jgi:hypothetical protein